MDCSRFMCWGNNQSINNEWNIKNLLLLSRESFSVVWIWCGKYSHFGAKILTAQSFPATDSLMLAPHSHWWFIYTQQGFLLESEVYLFYTPQPRRRCECQARILKEDCKVHIWTDHMDGRHAGLLTGRQMYIQPEKLPVNKSYNAHTQSTLSPWFEIGIPLLLFEAPRRGFIETIGLKFVGRRESIGFFCVNHL